MSTPGPVNLPPPSKRKTIALVAIGVIGASTVTILWLWNPDAERKAIQRLPQAERRVLYERTLRTLETTCRLEGRESGLEDFCQRQAEFILRFPECDAACSSVAESHRSVPSR
jgi:hypothetical protein